MRGWEKGGAAGDVIQCVTERFTASSNNRLDKQEGETDRERE